MPTRGQQVIWTNWGPGKRTARRRRVLLIAAGIGVLLIAGIGLAERGQAGDSQAEAPAADLLSPDIPHSRQGAQNAAAKMAAVLGGERMFNTADRHDIVESITAPDKVTELQQEYDGAYTAAFNKQLGLTAEGKAPAGGTFVSRTLPAGTTLRSYSAQEATVDVWCSTVFGHRVEGASDPIAVKSGWLTMTVTVRWTSGGWKLAESTEQHDGPEPTDADADFGTAPQL